VKRSRQESWAIVAGALAIGTAGFMPRAAGFVKGSDLAKAGGRDADLTASGSDEDLAAARSGPGDRGRFPGVMPG
jgi:hypothetical protein